jgi:hypothetical protein
MVDTVHFGVDIYLMARFHAIDVVSAKILEPF